MRPFIPIISPKMLNLFPWWNVKCCRALYLHNFRQRALKQRPRRTEWAGNDLQFSSIQKELMCLCKAGYGNVHRRSMCGIKIIECKWRLSANSGWISLRYWVLWRFEKVIQPHAPSKREGVTKIGCKCGQPAPPCVSSVRAASKRWALGLPRSSVCTCFVFACICSHPFCLGYIYVPANRFVFW